MNNRSRCCTNPSLFCLSNGSPLTFCLTKCRQFSRIHSLVSAGGGKLVQQPSLNSILLAAPGSLVSDDRYIHIQYINDCVLNGKRLPMKKYLVKPGILVTEMDSQLSKSDSSVVIKRKPFSQSESKAIWDFIVENNLQGQLNRRSCWHLIAKSLKSTRTAECLRSHYRQVLLRRYGPGQSRSKIHRFTREEDEQILNYIRENNLYDFINVRSTWKQMQRDLQMPHSSESMRSRFRHYLSKHLSHSNSIELSRTSKNSFAETTLTVTCSSSSDPQIDRTHSNNCDLDQNASSLDQQSEQNSSSLLVTLALPKTPNPVSSMDSAYLTSSICSILNSADMPMTPLQACFLISMTNGSVPEVLNFLKTGRRIVSDSRTPTSSPPMWTVMDDSRLNSCDLSDLRSLIQRFGPLEVCARIAYLSS